MARRRRPKRCQCGEPARRGDGTKLCAKCYAGLGRPKATCRVCSGEFAADRLVGKRCRPCISEAAHGKRIALTYAITPAEYAALLAHQGGGCAICLRPPRTRRLAVDHDHACCPGPISCGRCVRGLCCRQCNRWVLGSVRDDTETLLRAVRYLENPPAKEVLGRD